jgi:hypothetical protein
MVQGDGDESTGVVSQVLLSPTENAMMIASVAFRKLTPSSLGHGLSAAVINQSRQTLKSG